ncbi:MAG: DUF87 domain-containing protein [Deltaproteobacteria bacterium]
MVAAKLFAAPSLLPLWDVLDTGDIVTSRGQLLRAYALTGLDSEHRPAAELEAAAAQLYAGHGELADGAFLQFVVEGHDRYDDVFAAFDAVPPPDDRVLRLQRKRRVDFLRSSGLRRFDTTLVVGHVEGFTRSAFRQLSEREVEARRHASREVGRSVVGLLERAGVRARLLGREAILRSLHRGLNPSRDFAWACDQSVFDDDGRIRWLSCRERLFESAIEGDVDHVRCGARFHKVLVLRGLPDATRFTLPEALLHLPVAFRASVNFIVPDQARAGAVFEQHRRLAHGATGRDKYVEDAGRAGRVREANALAELLAETGQKLVQVGMQLVVSGESPELVRDEAEQAIEHLKRYGLTFIEETARHDVELPKTLPGMAVAFDRHKLVTSNNAFDLMPVFGGRHGDRDPVLLVKTAREELFSFNPVERARDNWNATVFGASGSGKSVTMNMLIATAMLANVTRGRVMVVDFAGETKSSYLQVARLFGGQFVPVVSREAGVAINPFPPPAVALDEAGALKSEHLNFLLVLTDLLLTNTGDDMDAALHRQLLQRALQRCYEGRTTRDGAPTYVDMAKVLEAMRGASDVDRDRLERIRSLLAGFLESPDSRFFTKPSNVVADASFVIFDLFGIDGLAPQTREALVFLVTEYVKRVAFGEEGIRYVVLDEVAQLLRRPEMRRLVDELYATARKHRTSVWTVTQNYGSYVESGLHEVVKLNSTTQLFLSHANAADVRGRVADDFDFNERERVLFERLVTKKGDYSEALIRTQCVNELGDKEPVTARLRIELSPFDYQLATSDAADRERQKKWIEQNPTAPLAAVLDALARKWASE